MCNKHGCQCLAPAVPLPTWTLDAALKRSLFGCAKHTRALILPFSHTQHTHTHTHTHTPQAQRNECHTRARRRVVIFLRLRLLAECLPALEGPASSPGYVHEMVTFSKVSGLRLYGEPETAHSWFPGYAWTIAHCGTCGQHLGWRFTATRAGLVPRSFWGIRRPGLLCASAPATTAAGGGGGSRGEPGAAAADEEQLPPQLGTHWMDLLLRGVRRGRLVLHLPQPQQQPGGGGGGAAAGD